MILIDYHVVPVVVVALHDEQVLRKTIHLWVRYFWVVVVVATFVASLMIFLLPIGFGNDFVFVPISTFAFRVLSYDVSFHRF